MNAFDHFAISAATLDDGAAHVFRHLGHVMGAGGEHALMGTHNRLSGLGPDAYFEVIAVNPAAPHPDRPRWFDLDRRQGAPRVGNWILRTDDLDELIARHPEAGRPLSFSRGRYRWRMAVPDDGILPFGGCFPALIEWQSAPPQFPDSGLRLHRLALRHPEADALRPILESLVEDRRIVLSRGWQQIEAEIETPDGLRRIT